MFAKLITETAVMCRLFVFLCTNW